MQKVMGIFSKKKKDKKEDNLLEPPPPQQRGSEDVSSSSSDDSSDEDEDTVEDLPKFPSDAIMNRARHSVSAEVYGQWNRKEAYKPPVYPKTGEQERRIRTSLAQSFLFQHLEEDAMKAVILAFVEKNLKPEERLIQQGDDGDCLYLIESGEVDVYKQHVGSTDPPQHMCVMGPGDTVGELALLYMTPRAATVVGKTDVVLWSLDRASFNSIVKEAAARRRAMYEHFLKEVDILKSMDDYERNKLSDALKTENFPENALVIKQGDIGQTFYIIEDGKAVALKNDSVVLEYKRGDYFGELALIKDQPRAATVKAVEGPLTCISMDRRSFKRLLGPVQDILKRRAGEYERIEAELRKSVPTII